MHTNTTQAQGSGTTIPTVAPAPTDANQYGAYVLGMSYVLKILMEVGARNASIMDVDQQINAKKELEEVILSGAQNHFQSAGEMASYFSYLAEHAASLGLSNGVQSWLQTQAQGITSFLNSPSMLNSDVKTAIANNLKAGEVTSGKDAPQYALYMQGVNVQLQERRNASQILEKEDEEGNLNRTADDQILGQLPLEMQQVVSSVTNCDT